MFYRHESIAQSVEKVGAQRLLCSSDKMWPWIDMTLGKGSGIYSDKNQQFFSVTVCFLFRVRFLVRFFFFKYVEAYVVFNLFHRKNFL